MKHLRPFLALMLLVFHVPALPAQDSAHASGVHINASPSTILFRPLIAHPIEARMGAVSLVSEDRLRLDIGNSVDLLLFPIGADGGKLLSVGADMFTWTSLRQDENFHFPVDAVDYLFGLNASYRAPAGDGDALLARFRFSHISAHLVDGSYDKHAGAWRDNRLPRVYSREFLDLIGAWEHADLLRVYAGLQYVYHIDPADLGRWSMQAGIEGSLPSVWQPWMNLYAAYDFRLIEIRSYTGSHSAQAGVKFGSWRGKGVRLFLAWYDGYSQHGEYFDDRWSYWGWGTTIDF